MEDLTEFLKNLLLLEFKINKYKIMLNLNNIDNLIDGFFDNREIMTKEILNNIYIAENKDFNTNLEPFLSYVSNDYESNNLDKLIFINYLKSSYNKTIPIVSFKKVNQIKVLLKLIFLENKIILFIRSNINENLIYLIENILFKNKEFKSFIEIYNIFKNLFDSKEEIILLRNRLFGFINKYPLNIIKFRINLNKLLDKNKIKQSSNLFNQYRNIKKHENKINEIKINLLKIIKKEAQNIINNTYNINNYLI